MYGPQKEVREQNTQNTQKWLMTFWTQKASFCELRNLRESLFWAVYLM